MRRSSATDFRDKELSALNAKMDALSEQDATAWEEAVDWGRPDCSALCPAEWRIAIEPDFD